ncbi:MAG: hypothetical protein ACKO0N_11045, partial [Planctomycetota bacterium]
PCRGEETYTNGGPVFDFSPSRFAPAYPRQLGLRASPRLSSNRERRQLDLPQSPDCSECYYSTS